MGKQAICVISCVFMMKINIGLFFCKKPNLHRVDDEQQFKA
jgi:hypothetical protein